jgi:uncharacterized protein YeaO (DUF488 family)
MASTPVRIKRIYEPAVQGDGYRILVDRLWPRGVSKAAAQIDLWLKDIGPSTITEQANTSPVTLVYSAKDEQRN